MENVFQSYTGIGSDGKKSKVPAWLDFLLTATGVGLALFMIAHMLLVSSILLGKEAMYIVAKMLELDFIFSGGEPFVVTIIAVVILVVFLVHGILGLRKAPTSYKAWVQLRTHKQLLKHSDTSLWVFQIGSGVIMLFTALIHLYTMVFQPQTIDPYGSSDRVFTEGYWFLYLVLLFCAEIHGSIGLYRAAIKWGWFDGVDYKATRKKLRGFKNTLSIVFLILGLATLGAYVKIGYEHQDNYGELYRTTAVEETK